MGPACCVSLAQPVSGTSVLCVIVLVGTEGRLVTPSSVDDGCHVPSSLSTLSSRLLGKPDGMFGEQG